MSDPPQADTQPTSTTAASTFASTSKNNSLIPTLSRLSQSTSRPSIPHDSADQGITRQTMRIGKEAWRRSGLSSLWRTNDETPEDTITHIKSRSDETSSSTESSSSMFKLRTQPLDTSSILYPTLTVHPPPVNHNILVLSLSHVGSAPPTLSNDELFNVLLRRLEPWVGEEGEGGYVLVVLADEDDHMVKGKEKRKLPGIGWWVWRWKRLPRKYRKNLKRLYIVHPSMFTRTLLPLISPFISPKSYSKLHPLPSLLSLHHTHGVSLKGIDISLPVLEAEARVLRDRPDIIPPTPSKEGTSSAPKLKRMDSESSIASWGYQTISSAVETAASYLPLPRFGVDSYHRPALESAGNKGYWGRDLDELTKECGGNVPPLLVELGKVILKECTTTEGVFRRTSNSHLLPVLTAILDLPISQHPNLTWTEIAREDSLLPPKILSRFLGELTQPILTSDMYSTIRETETAEDVKTKLIPSLSPPRAQILTYLIHLLRHLSLHSDQTKMTSLNLSIVIAPVLIRGPDPIEDTILCLEPGKPVPVGLRKMAEVNGLTFPEGTGTLVGLLDTWIREYPLISGEENKANCDLVGNRLSMIGSDTRRHSLLGSGSGSGRNRSTTLSSTTTTSTSID
ncbi:hypothetical protein I302_103626 [Kwoniella bestiolae CBS 10118]|uniref:Rho-GAP domain-containing protein n=1 Tax=Kwoniella bestiolae CBS 10118 TaxID=1296100 RepID=A0A1B9G8X3_9TREE|nr:hypothetical protein I302_02330 [Kwoniella bestiolae CBS 10118]OCF27488.1 hypothetical protein I302_02330 [Kwoniella bestiolae CBS 10118]